MHPVTRSYLLILFAVLANFTLWLDSFDRYVSSRYHASLSSVLPESFFQPSQYLLALITPPAPATDTATPTVAAAGTADKVAVALPDDDTPLRSDRQLRGERTASPQDAPETGALPRILFAGDSMMQGLAPLAIPQIRKSFPNGFFSDQSKQSTGLTVRRYFDWPTKIKDEIADKRFDTLVIFLGPNDPWDIYESGKRFVFPSEEWIAKYRSRVIEVMEYCRDRKVKVIWLGLPNMRDERLQRGASVENRIFREEAEKFGFDFLSTADILGPLDQPFRKYVDDPEKGRVTVRADDGIHFTPSGLRLINASLVELIRKRVSG